MNALANLALLGAFIRNPRRYPTYLGYVNGFIYGFTMGAAILFPLYAIEQGFSLASQGFIVAAPGVVMIMLRLLGGALSDRFGEKLIIWFSFTTVTIASAVPIFTATFLSLTVAQLFNGASRSVYWSAAQSYISRSAEGEAGKVMGRQLSFESGGGIIGSVVVGFVAEGIGYPEAFTLTATLSFIGFLITSSLPTVAAQGPGAQPHREPCPGEDDAGEADAAARAHGGIHERGVLRPRDGAVHRVLPRRGLRRGRHRRHPVAQQHRRQRARLLLRRVARVPRQPPHCRSRHHAHRHRLR